ncbi:D-alanyl-D-alanine carboxypeptidase [Methylosinus sp. Sm6]|uniref:D-alanyl-D-alanine carboxypeptidase n=1 Tax=Methylosinus sp. Sm6 TaxID=2866948 RepID=UPI0021051EEC|nr:D-alanyl-D-alanine carboxypeptidase [Methylosinus sp. Sm6]
MTNGNVASRLMQRKWAAFHVAAVSALLIAVFSLPAEARRHHGRGHGSALRHATHHRGGAHLVHAARRGGGGPAFAAIVVDANTGRTLYGRNESDLRHPASITKVMTLYLLFEQLEKGRLRLDSPLVISAHAAAQAPTKLGLPPGQTIDVENAIKAVVTKSANDIAVAIAENIAGDEDAFADQMTRKAHALGMSRTHYANASGLPNDEQVTTARDLAVLGRAIQDRFPRYYRYFSTYSFTYRGQSHRNHNRLLGQIEGVDGIKTGYTRASGFNLLSSVRRGGRHIVAVVLGGTSGPARDRIMAGLISEHIGEGDSTRTARAITENEPAAPTTTNDAAEEEDEAPAAAAPAHAAAAAPPARVNVVAPLALAPSPPPASVPTPDKAEKIRPAFVPGGQKRAEDAAEAAGSRPGRRDRERAQAATDGSTNTRPGRIREANAATTPPAAPRAAEKEVSSSARNADAGEIQKAETGRPPHGGWMIQIGATDDADKAQALLSRARAKGVPSTARPFTEKVHKGKEILWRARFAGLEEKSAESACKTLKRSGFSCFATKN